jgi:hypothetical protein
VTAYTQKNLPDLPEQAELHAGVRVKHIEAPTWVPGAELVVVGGPAEADLPENDNYVKLAKFGLTDRVIFTGQVEYAALPTLLRSADLVVNTCQYDRRVPVRCRSWHAAPRSSPRRSAGTWTRWWTGRPASSSRRTGRPCWRSGSGSCCPTPC